MRLKAVGIISISIFTTTVYANTINIENLSLRCHKASQKVEKLQAQNSDYTCKSMLSGTGFDLAGNSLASKETESAKRYLTIELKDLKYAESIGCKGQPIIKWAITEAQQINKLIS